MKKLFVSFVLCFNFIAFVNAQPSTARTGLRVEVMVFSGRPNPVFTITDPTQIREILSLADTMPQSTDGRAAQKQGLGYRGIAVTNLASDASKIETLKVYRSAVEIKRKPDTSAKNVTTMSAGDAATEARSDNGNALETRLLAMAVSRGVIEQRVLDQIKAK